MQVLEANSQALQKFYVVELYLADKDTRNALICHRVQAIEQNHNTKQCVHPESSTAKCERDELHNINMSGLHGDEIYIRVFHRIEYVRLPEQQKTRKSYLWRICATELSWTSYLRCGGVCHQVTSINRQNRDSN